MLQLYHKSRHKIPQKYPKITTYYYTLTHITTKNIHFLLLTPLSFDFIRPLLRLTIFNFYLIFMEKYMSKISLSSIKMADFGKNICLNMRNICLKCQKWTISTMFLTYILHSFFDKYKNHFMAKSNLDIYFSI